MPIYIGHVMNKFLLALLLTSAIAPLSCFATEKNLTEEVSIEKSVPKVGTPQTQSIDQENLKCALEILKKNASELKSMYELGIKEAVNLFKMSQNPANINGEIDFTDDLFQLMGGAIDYGKDHGWPDGCRRDNRFKAINLLRAASYYMESYSHIMSFCIFLEKETTKDNILCVESNLKSLLSSALSKSMQSEEIKQTKEEISKFGEYPDIDRKSLILSPWLSAIEYLNKSVSSTQHQELPAPDNKREIFSKLIKSYSEEIMKFDKDLTNLSIYFISYQYVKNKDFYGKNDIYQKLIERIKGFNSQKLETQLQSHIKNDAEPFLKFANSFDDYIKDKVLNSALFPKENLEEDEWLSPSMKKQMTKKNVTVTKKTKKEVCEEETDQKKSKEAKESKSTKKKEPKKGDSSKKKAKKEKKKPEEKVKKEEQSHHPKKTWEEKLEEKGIELKPTEIETRVDFNLDYNPFLTKEVVEKLLDIYGNQSGKTSFGDYQTQGWGTNDDFFSVLTSAGWLENQYRLENGKVVNEKHGSSTVSLFAPKFKNAKSIYLKFHGDHKKHLKMRPIAQHFIVENLEKQGYTKDFLREYYTKNKDNFEKNKV